MERPSFNLVDAASILALVTGIAWSIGAIYGIGILEAYGLPYSSFQYDVPTTIYNGVYVFSRTKLLVAFVAISCLGVRIVVNHGLPSGYDAKEKWHYYFKLLSGIFWIFTLVTMFMGGLQYLIKNAAAEAVATEKLQHQRGELSSSTLIYEAQQNTIEALHGWVIFYGGSFSVFYNEQTHKPVTVLTERIYEILPTSTNTNKQSSDSNLGSAE